MSKLLSSLLPQDHVQGQGQLIQVTLGGLQSRHVESMLDLLMTGETNYHPEVLETMEVMGIHLTRSSLEITEVDQKLDLNTRYSVETIVVTGDEDDVEESSQEKIEDYVEFDIENEIAKPPTKKRKRSGPKSAVKAKLPRKTKTQVQAQNLPHFDTCSDVTVSSLKLADETMENQDMSEIPAGSKMRVIGFLQSIKAKTEVTCPYCPKKAKSICGNGARFAKKHVSLHFVDGIKEKFPMIAESSGSLCPECGPYQFGYKKAGLEALIGHSVFEHDIMAGIWPDVIQEVVFGSEGKKWRRSDSIGVARTQ